MSRALILCGFLVGCSTTVPAGDGGSLSPDLADYRAAWNRDCCGLQCAADQLCVMETNGQEMCAPVPDGGVCAPGICGGNCGFGPLGGGGCLVSSFAHCEDFPARCLANPTCACLAPPDNSFSNCDQSCNDSAVVSDGILRCAGA